MSQRRMMCCLLFSVDDCRRCWNRLQQVCDSHSLPASQLNGKILMLPVKIREGKDVAASKELRGCDDLVDGASRSIHPA